MTVAEDNFAKAIRDRLKELDTNAYAVERKFGLPEDAIRSILTRKRKAGTSLNRAQEICNALGLELYIGPRREEVYRGFAEAAAAAFEHAGAPEAVTNVFRQGYLPIPWHDEVRQSAPPPLAVSIAWLKDHGLAPDNLRFVEVDGALALIDMAAPAHDEPGTWCWKEDGELRLGYGFRDPGGPFWIADASGNGPGRLVMPEDLGRFVFLGRAVWTGRFGTAR